MRIRDDIALRRREIVAAAAEHGARDVRIFGSVARGEDRADSDIDLVVTLDAGRTLLDLAELELRLEQLLGRKVDVITERSIRPPVRAEVLRDAVDV